MKTTNDRGTIEYLREKLFFYEMQIVKISQTVIVLTSYLLLRKISSSIFYLRKILLLQLPLDFVRIPLSL
jgi:hypothetical protein